MAEERELLGKKVRNRLTDFEGVCEHKLVWLFGCTQYAGTVFSNDKQKYFIEEEQLLEELETKVEVEMPIPMRKQKDFFGKKCRDKVSGFEGVCIGRRIGIYAVDQYCLESEVNEKGEIATQFFDEGRIVVIDEESIECDVVSDRPGGVTITYRNEALLEKVMNGSH